MWSIGLTVNSFSLWRRWCTFKRLWVHELVSWIQARYVTVLFPHITSIDTSVYTAPPQQLATDLPVGACCLCRHRLIATAYRLHQQVTTCQNYDLSNVQAWAATLDVHTQQALIEALLSNLGNNNVVQANPMEVSGHTLDKEL